jgi:hypothetical protein
VIVALVPRASPAPSRTALRVAHDLDVVALGVVDERGVVARAVVGPRSGRSVVLAARAEGGGVERIDLFAMVDAERET